MTGEYGDHLDFRGVRFFGPVTAKAEYYEHGPAPTALDALPARPVPFVGRHHELRVLLDALAPTDTGGPQTVLVTAVSGLGGIGKTALAVEAGHRACEQEWFPGGVLFVDLHGYDEEPVSPEQALEALLRALGTASQHIPTSADERAALYRSILAQRARERGPMLVLADNISLPDQVRFLRPGGANHRLLITSRERLPQLGARLLPLDELTSRASYDLLDRALRMADPQDHRIPSEADAALEVAARCGHLPLALQIAAARLVVDRLKPVSELAAELAEARDRLIHLDDGDRSVRAAFDLSFRRLPPEQARLLGLLAVAPGPEVTTPVINALTGADTPPRRDLLALSRAHLIEQGTSRGRWRLHDLVREFGANVVRRDEEVAARTRVLAFYCQWAESADARLRWLPGRPEPELFPDRVAALTWFDEERAGLVGTLQWAHDPHYAVATVRLAELLAVYLDWRRYFDDLIVVSDAARKAAAYAAEHHHEAALCTNLGNALAGAGRPEDAIDALDSALSLYRLVGDQHGEAIALSSRGAHLRGLDRGAEAVETLQRAIELYRTTADQLCEAIAWTALGLALAQEGRVAEAIDAHTCGHDLFRHLGDRHREGIASNNLGSALLQNGRVAEAIGSYARALEIYREFEDWYRTGRTLENLARAHDAAGSPDPSATAWRQAAEAFDRADVPDRAAEARAQAEAVEDRARAAAVEERARAEAAERAAAEAKATSGWGYPPPLSASAWAYPPVQPESMWSYRQPDWYRSADESETSADSGDESETSADSGDGEDPEHATPLTP